MNDREREVRADVLTFRSLAKLDASTREAAIERMGMNYALLTEKVQAEVLGQLYDGIEELAVRLGNRWEQALAETRDTILAEGSLDTATQAAYDRLIAQTNHLFH